MQLSLSPDPPSASDQPPLLKQDEAPRMPPTLKRYKVHLLRHSQTLSLSQRLSCSLSYQTDGIDSEEKKIKKTVVKSSDDSMLFLIK